MRKIKNIARITVFIVLLSVLLGATNHILEQKDSAIGLKPFLDHAEEYDVLFFGDSLVRYGIYPMELYHKHGITAYNMGSSNCMLPMSYWKMMNALDYATPKVVVVSVSDAENPNLVPGKGEWLHVALDAFPMTMTKAKAIFDLTSEAGADKNGVSYKDIRSELFFPLKKYHSRWSSLGMADFCPEYNTKKGAVIKVHVSDPQHEAGFVDEDECLPENGHGYIYLRRIIEACQEKGIPVVLYHPPAPLLEYNHKGTHTAERIAAEYGVPMLNMVDMNRVADYYVDCADPGGHLNYSGVLKVTDFLGQYLKSHYELPDRREDAAYAHWDDEWNVYVDEKVNIIAEEADSLRSRLMLLHDESFNIILTVRPDFDYEDDRVKTALQNIARVHVFEDDQLSSAEQEPLISLDDAADFNKGYMLIVDRDAENEYETVHEFYGIGEQEFETSFGYVFCRMDGEWIDLSITQEEKETYYFDNWEEQKEDMRLILIDRRTGRPALIMAFSRK